MARSTRDSSDLVDRQRTLLMQGEHAGLATEAQAAKFLAAVGMALGYGATASLPLASMYQAVSRRAPVGRGGGSETERDAQRRATILTNALIERRVASETNAIADRVAIVHAPMGRRRRQTCAAIIAAARWGMRAGLVALVVLACGPKASTTPPAFDDDLEPRAAPAAAAAPAPVAAAPAAAPRPAAAPGKGLRSGTIARARLVAVLDAGPATFLRQLEVAPQMAGDRFVGWQLVQLLDHTGPLNDVDVAPGDVLLAINGKPLSRPEQLQTLWDSLRTANDVTAQLRRGNQPLELHFTIEPPVP